MCEHGYSQGWDCPYCLCPFPGCGKTEADCPPGAHDQAPDEESYGPDVNMDAEDAFVRRERRKLDRGVA